MNLVAKEFVAARDDLDGVLILSELAGAAQELDEALIINPYDERGFTAAIARALEMPAWERRRRMQALRRRVAGRDVLAWASDILDRLERRKGQGFLCWIDTAAVGRVQFDTSDVVAADVRRRVWPGGTCCCSPTSTARSRTSRQTPDGGRRRDRPCARARSRSRRAGS